MLNNKIRKSIDESVLCWLATVSQSGMPNVSPKELFVAYQDEYLLIANIASPNSVNNISENPLVCVSFINVFKEKGYQLKGKAIVVPKDSSDFKLLYQHLPLGDCSKFPVKDIIQVRIQSAKEIVSPSYWLFPETTEQSQIAQALKTYRVAEID